MILGRSSFYQAIHILTSISVGIVVVASPVTLSHAADVQAKESQSQELAAWLAGSNQLPLRQVLPVSSATFSNNSQEEAATESAWIYQRFSEQQFLALTNAARQAAHLPTLRLNSKLAQAAREKALDMAQKGYWDHFRPLDHKAPWDFIKESGYTYRVAGENLARGFITPEGITKAWLNSPSHRANLLSARYAEVGFASIEVIDNQSRSTLLTVQMFGVQ